MSRKRQREESEATDLYDQKEQIKRSKSAPEPMTLSPEIKSFLQSFAQGELNEENLYFAAARYCRIDILEYAWQQKIPGYDIADTNPQRIPLWQVALYDDDDLTSADFTAVADCLLRNKIPGHDDTDYEDKNIWHCACAHGKIAAINWLLNHTKKIATYNALCLNGQSPLDYLIVYCRNQKETQGQEYNQQLPQWIALVTRLIAIGANRKTCSLSDIQQVGMDAELMRTDLQNEVEQSLSSKNRRILKQVAELGYEVMVPGRITAPSLVGASAEEKCAPQSVSNFLKMTIQTLSKELKSNVTIMPNLQQWHREQKKSAPRLFSGYSFSTSLSSSPSTPVSSAEVIILIKQATKICQFLFDLLPSHPPPSIAAAIPGTKVTLVPTAVCAPVAQFKS